MDAGEDQDVLLQQSAAGYISELRSKLPKFLFHQKSPSRHSVRAHVRKSTTTQLCNLLEPFQEWPQLLDPSLADLIRPLQEALTHSSRTFNGAPTGEQDPGEVVVSISQAVCRILYTLCKVRGPKVISRFLENGAEHLEFALDALAARSSPNIVSTWEEKYVYLLWVAHLLFTPFDLRTVGSSELDVDNDVSFLPRLPQSLPPIAARIIHLSVLHLPSASKEREGAVKVLSRLTARPDMLRLRLHGALLEYAISMLQELHGTSHQSTPYKFIGYLSLLAGLLSSLPAAELEPYLLRIFRNITAIVDGRSSCGTGLNLDAVSHRIILKNMRLLSILALQVSQSSGLTQDQDLANSILEDTVDHLLTSLADKDTPVRQAASKALSAIAAKLQPDMAAEVMEAVIGALDENVLWIDDADPLVIRSRHDHPIASRSRGARRDLSAVDPLRWHGLVLSLAQLLFQRSAPASQLPTIVSALVLALSFDQRASSGTSLGANVRDAANFGIWSIARKFATADLLQVQVTDIKAFRNEYRLESISLVQALAAELIVAATLDPSGNIRRGSSAALQELIGRHPETIFEGIPVVQVVDYHAVALRAKAFAEVAVQASQLHPFYWTSTLAGMMGWRGVEAADAPSRRLAAKTIGVMSRRDSRTEALLPAQLVYNQLKTGFVRDVERRHGLLLAASEIIHQLPLDDKGSHMIQQFWALLRPGKTFELDDLTSSTRRPGLTCEALLETISALAGAAARNGILEYLDQDVLRSCQTYLSISIERAEQEVIPAASHAARNMFILLDAPQRSLTVSEWIQKIDSRLLHGTPVHTRGYFAMLGAVFNRLGAATEESLRQDILGVMARALQTTSSAELNIRVLALTALDQGVFDVSSCVPISISDCLKRSLQDHTINDKGDVGSLVRVEALAVVRNVLQAYSFEDVNARRELLAIVTALAGEKLDKVRFAAWSCIEEHWKELEFAQPPPHKFSAMNQTTSIEYFLQLVVLCRADWARSSVLKGLCSSAGSGSESVLRAARSAFTRYLIDCTADHKLNIMTRIFDIFRNSMLLLHQGRNLEDLDYITVPLLETLGFLLQTHLLDDPLLDANFPYGKLLRLVQKSHYKSSSVQKLTAAVNLYKGLHEKEEVRIEALTMLKRLMLHPQPRVRNAAADAFYLACPKEEILKVNWSTRPADLKGIVMTLRGGLEDLNGRSIAT